MPVLKRKAKDGDDAVHGFVLPSHRTTAIRRVVPEARAGSMKAGTVLLHDGTRYDVLKWLLKFGQLVEALFDDVWRPLVYFVVSVSVAPYGALDGFFDDVADFVDDESGLLGSVEIIHCQFLIDGSLFECLQICREIIKISFKQVKY